MHSMVLIRNRLSSLDHQRIVKESQAMAQQFYRPKTGGGRKYLLYSVSRTFLHHLTYTHHLVYLWLSRANHVQQRVFHQTPVCLSFLVLEIPNPLFFCTVNRWNWRLVDWTIGKQNNHMIFKLTFIFAKKHKQKIISTKKFKKLKPRAVQIQR